MTPANYWKLGLFIVLCCALALGTLAFIGAEKLDRDVTVVHYYFNEPVDGLAVGSQIRLRGIPVGQVTAIGLAKDRTHVEVEGEIDDLTLERLGLKLPGEPLDLSHLHETITENGLRAYLERNILTGVSLINSDYFEEFAGADPEYAFDVPICTIPTIPSTIKGIMADVESTLRWIRTELPAIATSIEGLISELDHTLTALDTQGLSTDVRELVATLDGRAGTIADSLGRTLAEGEELLSRIGSPGGPVENFLTTYRDLGEEVRGTLKTIDPAGTRAALGRTLGAIEDAGDGIAGLSDQLSADLELLGRALESAQRLAELLERDPSSLLRGREASRSPIERLEP